MLLYGIVDGDECFEEGFHLTQRPRIRTVAKCFGRIRVCFHEQAGDPGSSRGARQHGNKLALPA